MPALRAIVLWVAVAVSAVPLVAQTAIRVVDEQGRPIASVRVELVGRGEVIAVDSTGADGVASLQIERWDEVRRLTLNHLGFQTLIVQADQIPVDGIIRLGVAAVEIEGLAVQGGDLCTGVDDSAARAMWSEVAALYASSTSSRAKSARFTRQSGPVRATELYQESTRPGQARVHAIGAGTIHGGDLTPRSFDDRVRSEGYAWPPLMIDGTGAGDEVAWQYADLDHAHANHFATSVFGDLHDLDFASGSDDADGEVVLVFCPRAGAVGPTIRGVLTLMPGEAMMSAEWRFDTGERDEGAGGLVTFRAYPQAGDLKPHLMAARGIQYLHSGLESPYPDLPRSYRRRVRTYSDWYVHEGAGHPCKPGDGQGWTVYGSPPRSAEGVAFHACLTANWGRE